MTMDQNIQHTNTKNLQHHGTLFIQLPAPKSHKVTAWWREQSINDKEDLIQM